MLLEVFKIVFMKFILCACNDFNTFRFIFKGVTNKLKLGF